jgi:hypothetical protein
LLCAFDAASAVAVNPAVSGGASISCMRLYRCFCSVVTNFEPVERLSELRCTLFIYMNTWKTLEKHLEKHFNVFKLYVYIYIIYHIIIYIYNINIIVIQYDFDVRVYEYF